MAVTSNGNDILPLGVDGQILSSQGLLIPAASMGGQLTTSSTAASLSTSVIPTSAIQSVMTTQIQVGKLGTMLELISQDAC